MYGDTQESYSTYWKYDTPLEIITKRRDIWFGRVVRAKSTMASTILLSKDEGENDEEGQYDSHWMMDGKEWTD